MTTLAFDRRFDAVAGVAEQISPRVRRVLCGNAGPFTFTGTSTFIVGTGRVAIIDPGPDEDAHLAALLEAVRGETVEHIAVTHSHMDHSALAARLQAATGAATVGYRRIAPGNGAAGVDHGFDPDIPVDSGATLAGPGWTLEALFTPGHLANHVCFALREEKTLFTGDHVMAWNTSVVAPPGGHMGDYMASLRLLLDRDDDLYLPAHGPARRDPKPLAAAYLAHRERREAAILERIAAGDRSIAAIVAALYAGLDPKLQAAAAASTLAHVEHLAERGLARWPMVA